MTDDQTAIHPIAAIASGLDQSEPRLIDIRLTHSTILRAGIEQMEVWLPVLLGLGMALAADSLQPVMGIRGSVGMYVGLALGVVGGLAMISIWRHKSRSARDHVARRLTIILYEHANLPAGSLFVPGGPADHDTQILAAYPDEFIDVMARGRFTSGCAFRISSRSSEGRSLPEPIQVSFEPVPLDESDPAFVELAALCSARITNRKERLPRFIQTPAQEWSARLRRLIRNGQLRNAVFVIIAICFSFHNSRAASPGVSWTSLDWRTGAIASLIGLMFLIVLRRPSPKNQTWLFPGGISNERGLFRREGSTLIWWPDRQKLSVVLPGYPEGIELENLTPAEAMVTLAAWFSPAPPPSDEMLQGFFGST